MWFPTTVFFVLSKLNDLRNSALITERYTLIKGMKINKKKTGEVISNININ